MSMNVRLRTETAAHMLIAPIRTVAISVLVSQDTAATGSRVQVRINAARSFIKVQSVANLQQTKKAKQTSNKCRFASRKLRPVSK